MRGQPALPRMSTRLEGGLRGIPFIVVADDTTWRTLAVLCAYRLLIAVLVGVAFAFFNQFSGINAILYYLNDIFAGAGFSKLSASLQAVFVAA